MAKKHPNELRLCISGCEFSVPEQIVKGIVIIKGYKIYCR
jgi:hypothetical protein